MRSFFTAAALLFAILISPPAAMAHKVMVFAWVENESVHTESKFSGGKKVQGGKIEVFDHADRQVAQGLTDDRGRFDFSRPPDVRLLKVVLTSGMGHTNHWTITAEELGATAPRAAVKPTAPEKSGSTEAAAAPPLDAVVIEQIVERSLEKKLAPLRAQMAQQSWGLRDIVAGMGYILGLMGLASYLHYRKKA